MKIIILNTDYDAFLKEFYLNPDIKNLSYKKQMEKRNETLFGLADFYSFNLNLCGHEAYEIHANNEYMQYAWAKENGEKHPESKLEKESWYLGLQSLRKKMGQTGLRKMKGLFRGVLKWMDNRNNWLYKILKEQIIYYKPDVIINQSLDGISGNFIKEIKPFTKIIVGQIAAPIPKEVDLSVYDFMLSSLPNYLNDFRQAGLQAEYHPFAFDERVLTKFSKLEKDISLSFTGSISIHHKDRNKYLVPLTEKFDMKIWGQGVKNFDLGSSVRQAHMGGVFGKDLLSILGRSQITFNHHIGIAKNYCNNMRMFEATGMGAALLTDMKDNLCNFFEDGKEVIAYGSLEDCLEKLSYYSQHPGESLKIGKMGQKRVLKDHNYQIRMQELSDTLERYL